MMKDLQNLILISIIKETNSPIANVVQILIYNLWQYSLGLKILSELNFDQLEIILINQNINFTNLLYKSQRRSGKSF